MQDDERHYGGAFRPMTNPYEKVKQAELPVEHELYEESCYADPTERYGKVTRGTAGPGWLRLAPVAVYIPKPETPEPKGLGAVVRDSGGSLWVRCVDSIRTPWRNAEHGFGGNWQVVKKRSPVEVLSRGVEL